MSHSASTSAAPELREREFRGGVVSGDERLGAVYRLDALRRIPWCARLSPDESERVLGLLRLVGQAEAIVGDAGQAERFNAAT